MPTAIWKSRLRSGSAHCDLEVAVEVRQVSGARGGGPAVPTGICRTSTASSRSQWALLDLNRELQIAVGTAGPQPRLPGRSGHCRTSIATSRSQWALPTSTATSRSQWALPDLNGKNVRKDFR